MTMTDETAAPHTEQFTWLAVARDTAAVLADQAATYDESGDFHHEAFRLVRENGISSMLVPVECGGPGASHAEACAVLAEIGKADAAVAVTLSMHFHLVATQVWRFNHGFEAPILERVHAEKLILVSTGASDWTDSYGSATRVDGGFRISARKAPSSGAPAGDIAITSVPWMDGPDGPQVVHCAVPFDAEGVSIDETWNATGIRASGSHTIVFDDVFVPDRAVSLIRPRGPWPALWNTVIGAAMPLIMSAYLGAADRAVEIAREVGRAKADQDHIPPTVGQMLNCYAVAHDAVRAMVSASENLTFDATDEHSSYVLTRKTVSAEAMIETVRRAVNVVGGAGYSRGNELERIFRDIHGCQFHPLPEAKQIQFTGRLAVGLDPLG